MHAILNENLEKYLEGRLPESLRAALDRHLTQCAGCRETLDEVMECSQMLKLLAATEDGPEPAPGFAIKVLQGIEAAKPARSWVFGWLPSPMVRQMAMASVMLAALLTGYVFTLQTTIAGPVQVAVDDETVAPSGIATHVHHQKGGYCEWCWHQSRFEISQVDSDQAREATLAAVIEPHE